MLLQELHRSASDYYGHLATHLADALFFTACRFHEWSTLEVGKLVLDGDGTFTTTRLKVKGGKHRDLPILPHLSDSLAEWLQILEAFRGVRLRRGSVDFAGSRLIFPGREGAPISNPAFNQRLRIACRGRISRCVYH
ncbi:MAG: hypothetical protein AAF591_22155 [Verrucomicrobiota bacterium]